MEAAKGKSVPINSGEKVVRDGEPLYREKFSYSELVGSLLYLSVCTRPDIAQAVGVCNGLLYHLYAQGNLL
jgi:hypothetical protein